jgi:hypothetical protein
MIVLAVSVALLIYFFIDAKRKKEQTMPIPDQNLLTNTNRNTSNTLNTVKDILSITPDLIKSMSDFISTIKNKRNQMPNASDYIEFNIQGQNNIKI